MPSGLDVVRVLQFTPFRSPQHGNSGIEAGFSVPRPFPAPQAVALTNFACAAATVAANSANFTGSASKAASI